MSNYISYRCADLLDLVNKPKQRYVLVFTAGHDEDGKPYIETDGLSINETTRHNPKADMYEWDDTLIDIVDSRLDKNYYKWNGDAFRKNWVMGLGSFESDVIKHTTGLFDDLRSHLNQKYNIVLKRNGLPSQGPYVIEITPK